MSNTDEAADGRKDYGPSTHREDRDGCRDTFATLLGRLEDIRTGPDTGNQVRMIDIEIRACQDGSDAYGIAVRVIAHLMRRLTIEEEALMYATKERRR